MRTLADGSQVVENTTTPTTTSKEIQTVKSAPPEIVRGVADAVETFVDIFTGGVKCDSAVIDCNGYDRKSEPTFEREFPGERGSMDGTLDECTTMGDWTTDSLRSELALPAHYDDSCNKAAAKKERRADNQTNSDKDREQEPRQEWSNGNTDGHKEAEQPSRKDQKSCSNKDAENLNYDQVILNSKPLSQRRLRTSTPQQPQPQPQPQPTRRTAKSRSTLTAFFQKTYPGGNNISSNNNQSHKHNDNNEYNGIDAETDGVDIRHLDSVGAHYFTLYESDRCEQLPVLQKVTDNKGVGAQRSLVWSYSNASGAVNKSMKLELRSDSNGRCSRKKNRDPKGLDPHVANAIQLMRDRSRSRSRTQPQKAQVKMNSHIRRPSPQPPRQPAYTQQLQQQQLQPTRPMISNQPPVTSASSPRADQNSSMPTQLQAKNDNIFRSTPPTRIGAGDKVDFDRLPLGHLANPIQWDDASDMRDDFDTVGVTARANSMSGGNSDSPSPPTANQSRSSKESRRQSLSLYSAYTKKKHRQSRMKTKEQQQHQPASLATATNESHANKNPMVPSIPPATLVKYNQALLPLETQTVISDPKIAIHKTNAVVSSDEYVHFYTYRHGEWVQTTTVSLQDTHKISWALWQDTAVVGVPYDRNSKGLLTGSTYIFERDSKSNRWYQVKKIVPKKVQGYATVGYSVDICDNVVAVGVPELGATTPGPSGGGGSAYVYKRVEQFKWAPMGHLTMSGNGVKNIAAAGGTLVPPTTTKFGTTVALRGKILVVSNYRQDDISNDTSLLVYEYDISLKSKWRLMQNLVSMEGQRRHFGSHVALTTDGEGVFIGCHSEVDPTEILYYRRKGQPDQCSNRTYQLQQIIALHERCDIANFMVDEKDTLALGTLNSNRVYIYQQLYNLNTMEDQGWKMVCKVANSPERNGTIDRFGSNVGLHGDNVLVGSKGNVYSYSLERWRTAKNKKSKLQYLASSRSISSQRRRLMSSLSPSRFRH